MELVAAEEEPQLPRRRSSRLTPPLGMSSEARVGLLSGEDLNHGEGETAPASDLGKVDIKKQTDEEDGSNDENDKGNGDDNVENEPPRYVKKKKYTTRLRLAKQRSIKQTKTFENYIGRRILRYFNGEAFFGEVTEYLPPEEKDDAPLFQISHDDGDTEQLELHELEKALADLDEYSGGRHALRDRRKSRAPDVFTISSWTNENTEKSSRRKVKCRRR